MHRDAASVAADKLALAGVKPGPYVDSKRMHGIGDALRTAYRPRGSLNPRKDAVAGRADVDPAILPKLLPSPPIDALQEIAPTLVSHGRGMIGRADDVGEENRRQNAIRFPHVALASDKFLDLVDDRFGIGGPGEMVGAGEFDQFRVWNLPGYVTAGADVGGEVAGRVQDQCRHPNRGQNVANVDLVIHPRQGRSCARARTHT